MSSFFFIFFGGKRDSGGLELVAEVGVAFLIAFRQLSLEGRHGSGEDGFTVSGNIGRSAWVISPEADDPPDQDEEPEGEDDVSKTCQQMERVIVFLLSNAMARGSHGGFEGIDEEGLNAIDG
jgi:hypothetical protein